MLVEHRWISVVDYETRSTTSIPQPLLFWVELGMLHIGEKKKKQLFRGAGRAIYHQKGHFLVKQGCDGSPNLGFPVKTGAPSKCVSALVPRWDLINQQTKLAILAWVSCLTVQLSKRW